MPPTLPRTPSGNEFPGMDFIHSVATESARAAVAEALSQRAREDGATAAALVNMQKLLQSLHDDIAPLLESRVRHDTVLQDHDKQLDLLWKSKEEESARVEKKANEAVRSMIHSEFVDAAKQKRTAWEGVMPAVVGSVVASVITAAIFFVLPNVIGQDKKDDSNERNQPASTKPPGGNGP